MTHRNDDLTGVAERSAFAVVAERTT